MAQICSTDVVMVVATLAGPILAVQAQKWVERIREASSRRHWVFTVLMATRQSRVSIDHVRALNSIDLTFYGARWFNGRRRRATDQAVLDAWHEYHSHLTLPDDRRPQNDAQFQAWYARGDELFANLLERLASATHYKFDRRELKSGSYIPEAHGTVEGEQHALRHLAVELLRGNITLPLDVRNIHVTPEAAAAQQVFQERLIANQIDIANRLTAILERLTGQRPGENPNA